MENNENQNGAEPYIASQDYEAHLLKKFLTEYRIPSTPIKVKWWTIHGIVTLGTVFGEMKVDPLMRTVTMINRVKATPVEDILVMTSSFTSANGGISMMIKVEGEEHYIEFVAEPEETK